ncbi:hypothetical protein FGO68_gene7929 [Halteria grandinella]|uniref:RRM domain-containing protein n=1 Tax=Halteria grandinella TaxID=5974 RepID=A0A8J8NUJ1_HALGN|nr:hypothetical protein FGO68_gene7929 [Halteria grandinella]
MKNLRDIIEPKPQHQESSSDAISALLYDDEDEDLSPQFNFNELIQQQSILSRLKKTDAVGQQPMNEQDGIFERVKRKGVETENEQPSLVARLQKPGQARIQNFMPLGLKRTPDVQLTPSGLKLVKKGISAQAATASQVIGQRSVVAAAAVEAPKSLPTQYKVEVLNIASTASEAELKAFLTQFGRVSSINLNFGRAVVTFAEEKWMLNAIAQGNGMQFKDRLVTIKRPASLVLQQLSPEIDHPRVEQLGPKSSSQKLPIKRIVIEQKQQNDTALVDGPRKVVDQLIGSASSGGSGVKQITITRGADGNRRVVNNL